MAKQKFGFRGKFYRNTATGANAYATPTWAEVKIIGDLQVNGQFDEADATTRESAGVKLAEPTLLALEWTGKVRVDDEDADFLALDSIAYTRAAFDVLVLDGPRDQIGVRGWRADVKTHNWGEDQALGNIIMKEFTFKPCVGNPPKRAVVTGTPPGPGTLSYVAADAANP